MTIVIAIIGLLLMTYSYMQQPKFGKTPTGERLDRVKKSPNFRDGKFQNLSHTPDLTEGVGYLGVMKEFLFGDKSKVKPPAPLPSVKTDLFNLNPSENVLVWFGHSSYFMQVDGKRVLVDPVLSGAASPLKFTTRSFGGTDVYTPDDIPEIDYLFISHDHWDHLDYETVVRLRPKIRTVVCGLGIAEHLEHWGYAQSQIIERDWNEEIMLDAGFVVHTAPARHFSGRGFSRNQALWTSFVLQTPTHKIFIGGDSGHDGHFAEIGAAHGPFDLAILECGQYDKSWKYIHLMPEEAVQAAQELGAKRLLPVHWGKFALANHDWDDPIIRVSAQAQAQKMPLCTPLIGEKMELKNERDFSAWWEKIK